MREGRGQKRPVAGPRDGAGREAAVGETAVTAPAAAGRGGGRKLPQLHLAVLAARGEQGRGTGPETEGHGATVVRTVDLDNTMGF